MNNSMSIIVNKLPSDYRWATCCEAENWTTLVDAIQIRRVEHGWDATDIAVPIQTPLGCMCEYPTEAEFYGLPVLVEDERYEGSSRSW